MTHGRLYWGADGNPGGEKCLPEGVEHLVTEGLDTSGAAGPFEDLVEEAGGEFEPLDLEEPGVEGLGLAGGVV